MPQNFITLHNIGPKFLADKGEKAKLDYLNCHNIAKSFQAKVETYVKEHKHRVGILQDIPRAATEQEQEVVGLFRTYGTGASFTNQDAARAPVNMKLAFTEEHVKAHDVVSAQVATSLAKLAGDKLVRQFVALCACEVKFLCRCSVPWDKIPVAGQSASADQGSDPASVAASRRPSPKPKLTQAQAPSKAQALSSGGEEDDDGDINVNRDAYGSGDDRGGDRNVQFTMIDPDL